MNVPLMALVFCLLTGAFVPARAEPPAYDLNGLIAKALANNPDMAVAEARLQQADAELTIRLARFYPEIQARLSYQHSNDPARAFAMVIAQRRLDLTAPGSAFNRPGGIDDYRPEVSARYALFRGGQDYHHSQAAALAKEAVEQEQKAVRGRLINQVTAAYYGELAARAAHAADLSSVSAVSAELEQTERQFNAGTALKADWLSLQVEQARARDAVLRSEQAIELAHDRLRILLGLAVDQPFSLARAENKAPMEPRPLARLLTEALSRHPRLLAAKKRAAAERQRLDAALGAYLPRADAYVAYGSNSPDLAFSGKRDNVTAGVVVEIDLFNGFATPARVRQARQALVQAQEQTRELRLQLEHQVKTAHLGLLSALSRRQVAESAARAAEEALRLITLQRQAGTATVSRYLEAESARDQALTRAITAGYDAWRAEADLHQAIGLWSEPENFPGQAQGH